MTDKAIHIQTEHPQTGVISVIKPVPWASLTCDNVKMVVHAYESGQPRENSLIEVVDAKNIYHLTMEELVTAIQFYKGFHANGCHVGHMPNRLVHIIPDAIKKPQNQRI